MDNDTSEKKEYTQDPQTDSPLDTRNEHAAPVDTTFVAPSEPAVAPPVAPVDPPAPTAQPATPLTPPPAPVHDPQLLLPPHATNGLAIAAFVTGIVAFLSGLIPFWGVVVGIAAVVLGILAIRRPSGKAFSIIGIIGGGLAFLTSAVVTVGLIYGLASIDPSSFDSSYTEQSQSTSDSESAIGEQKDFEKGETAHWGELDVTIDSVQRNYIPESAAYQPESGEEYVLLKLTVKNNDSVPTIFTVGLLSVDEIGPINGATPSARLLTEIGPMGVPANGSVTGNVVFAVAKDSADLTLVYDTSVYDEDSAEFTDLTYSLKF